MATIKTDAELLAQVLAGIKVNGNRAITPPVDKSIRDNFIASKLNIKDGGNIIQALTGYSSELVLDDRRNFVYKGHLDDNLSAYFKKDGSVTATGDFILGGFNIKNIASLVDASNNPTIQSNNRRLYSGSIGLVAKWENGVEVSNNGYFALLDTSLLSADNTFKLPSKVGAQTFAMLSDLSGVGTGTVTSVGITGSDFTISGSPVTTSGNISLTLATVNSNVGTFNNVTVNAKGLITAASNISYLTANQTITLSGDISGSGSTTITTAIGASKVTNAMLFGGIGDGKLSSSYLYADGTRALTAAWYNAQNASFSMLGIGTGSTAPTSLLQVVGSLATSSNTVIVSGNTSNGSNQITVGSNTGLYVGMSVTGTGIPAGSYIKTISVSTLIYLNVNATATNTGVSLTFTPSSSLQFLNPTFISQNYQTGLLIRPVGGLGVHNRCLTLDMNGMGGSSSAYAIEISGSGANTANVMSVSTTNTLYTISVANSVLTANGGITGTNIIGTTVDATRFGSTTANTGMIIGNATTAWTAAGSMLNIGSNNIAHSSGSLDINIANISSIVLITGSGSGSIQGYNFNPTITTNPNNATIIGFRSRLTDGTNRFSIDTDTAPCNYRGVSYFVNRIAGSNITDSAQIYATDFIAGNAVIHSKCENGDVIRLVSDGGWTKMTGTPQKGTLDTATATLPQLAGKIMSIEAMLYDNLQVIKA